MTQPEFEVSETKKGLQSVGPFHQYKVTLDGYRIPRLTGRLVDGRWHFCLDERFGVDVPEQDGPGVAMMIANALAIGSGFTCHGENSQPSNEFKTQMHGIRILDDLEAMEGTEQ